MEIPWSSMITTLTSENAKPAMIGTKVKRRLKDLKFQIDNW